RPDALFVNPDPFFVSRLVQLVHLASRHGVPATYGYRQFAEAGGLMSYGPSVADAMRQVGIYTRRILKGAEPAEFPALQSAEVDLGFNHPVAKEPGLPV